MRIHRQMLLDLAEDTVSQRVKEEEGALVAAYLHGAVLLEEEPLLGRTADIDLVLVFADGEPRREVVPVVDEVHFDIQHHPESLYQPPRDLRTQAWLGHTVCTFEPLYDPDHFLAFVQAGVRGLFNETENVRARAQALLSQARQIWLDLQGDPTEPDLETARAYLRALRKTANAVACLSGPPLTERRFMLAFPGRAEAVGRAGLHDGLMDLLGAGELDGGLPAAWLENWEAAYETVAAQEEPPADLHPARRGYHRAGFTALLESERPAEALWPLLNIWTRAIKRLPAKDQARTDWAVACERLGLLGEAFPARLSGLDAYLDAVEELVEGWGGE